MSRISSSGRAPASQALGQRLRAGGADRFQQAGVDRLHHPVGRRLGGHRPEQGLLAAQHAEVCDVIAAVGDRDGEVAQDDAGVVGAAALPRRRHRLRERRGEPEPVGQLDQQKGAGVGDEPLAVRPDFYGLRRRLCLHLPGVLLGRWEWVSQTAFSRPKRTLPEGFLRSLIGGSRLGSVRAVRTYLHHVRSLCGRDMSPDAEDDPVGTF